MIVIEIGVMVDSNYYDDIFTKEELSAAKDNFFSVLGELYNGEALQIILTGNEREIKRDYKTTIPAGYEEFETTSFNKNKNSFNLILSLFINLIINLNPQFDEDIEIYLLKISIITMTCLNGSITKEDNFNVSDIKFDKDYIKANKGKIDKDNLSKIEKVIAYFPLANNFLAFSTLNYIRFNHHFPQEKIHLMKKSLLSFNSRLVEEMIEEDGKNTFYDCLVTPARINNELVFYEKLLNQNMKELHNNKFKYYKILGTVPTKFEDELIMIRNVVTPNGFLVLDIVKAMLEDLRSKNLLFLLPNLEIFGKLMSLRNYLRKNPFGYHNSKIFFKSTAKDYEEVKKKFLSYMSIVGGFIYGYTEKMEDSIIQAKCRIKYRNKVNLNDEKLIKTIYKVADEGVTINDNDVVLLRSKLNKFDLVISDDIDLKLENDRADALINNNSDDF